MDLAEVRTYRATYYRRGKTRPEFVRRVHAPDLGAAIRKARAPLKHGYRVEVIETGQ